MTHLYTFGKRKSRAVKLSNCDTSREVCSDQVTLLMVDKVFIQHDLLIARSNMLNSRNAKKRGKSCKTPSKTMISQTRAFFTNTGSRGQGVWFIRKALGGSNAISHFKDINIRTRISQIKTWLRIGSYNDNNWMQQEGRTENKYAKSSNQKRIFFLKKQGKSK